MQFEETIYASSMYAHQIPTIAVTFVLNATELHVKSVYVSKLMKLLFNLFFFTQVLFSAKFIEFLRNTRKIDSLTGENLRLALNQKNKHRKLLSREDIVASNFYVGRE